jgi:hypothetical protein
MIMYLVRSFVLLGLLNLIGFVGYGQSDTTDTFCKEVSRIVAIINDPKDSLISLKGKYIKTEKKEWWMATQSKIYKSKINIAGALKTTLKVYYDSDCVLEARYKLLKSQNALEKRFCVIRETLLKCFPNYTIKEDKWDELTSSNVGMGQSYHFEIKSNNAIITLNMDYEFYQVPNDLYLYIEHDRNDK